MITKIRNSAVIALVVGMCVMGLLGPIMYPEYMIEAQLNSSYYMPLI